MKPIFQFCKLAALTVLLPGFASTMKIQAADNLLPHLETRDGRHAFFVDGAPFLMLGAQSHNSSAWPDVASKSFRSH